MHRTLHPELLDSLEPADPAAIHNRRDLRITNAIMGNHRWFLRALPRLLQPGEQVLEIGAGTGELGLRLNTAGLAVDGLDLWPRPEDWPANRAWYRSDLRHFDGYSNYAAIIGNLIFHQFSDPELHALGKNLASARVILGCEPTRRRSSQALFRLLAPALGANDISLHDAHVSIAAGFQNHELPAALGLDAAAWETRCHRTAVGAYHMTALRRMT